MRRGLIAALATAAMFAAVPAAAEPAPATPASEVNHGWVPVPAEAFDREAGVLCDFPIHSEPIVDEVRMRTLETYPDGSPRRELYVGDLILQVTNTATGATTEADASGRAIIEYGTDGSMTWYVVGPVLLGFREGSGNLPRGLWVVDGVYTVEFSPRGVKTVTHVLGTDHNVCTDLD